MPCYSYRCDMCESIEDRVVPFEDRERQLCRNPVSKRLRVEPDGSERPLESVCSAPLAREEIAITARMSTSWRP